MDKKENQSKTRGLFISIDGGEGAGKTTQMKILAESLQKDGYTTVITCEPGGTELGIKLREILLNSENVSPRAEALLYAADRADHVSSLIRPALERGEVVITDRYLDSSVAYQGAARSLGADQVRELSLWATEELLPDVTFFLDIDVKVGFERKRGDKLDRLEKEPTAFHEEVRKMFIKLAKNDPGRVVVVNASQNMDEIAKQIKDEVDSRMKLLKTEQ